MCMVIRQKNMVFKDRRTEEQEGLLAGGVRQENRRTWGLLAEIRQKNRRTCSLVEG